MNQNLNLTHRKTINTFWKLGLKNIKLSPQVFHSCSVATKLIASHHHTSNLHILLAIPSPFRKYLGCNLVWTKAVHYNSPGKRSNSILEDFFCRKTSLGCLWIFETPENVEKRTDWGKPSVSGQYMEVVNKYFLQLPARYQWQEFAEIGIPYSSIQNMLKFASSNGSVLYNQSTSDTTPKYA